MSKRRITVEFQESEYLIAKGDAIIVDTVHTNYERACMAASRNGGRVVSRKWWERKYGPVAIEEYAEASGPRISQRKRAEIVAAYINRDGNQKEIAEKFGVLPTLVCALIKKYRGLERR